MELRTWVIRLTAVAATLVAAACSDEIILNNLPPAATVNTIEAELGVVDIYYDLSDFEADDVTLSISVCRGDQCQTPTAAPGGDGTRSLPTQRNANTLHLFRWAAGCDLDQSGLDSEWTVRLTPRDQKAGATVASEAFQPTGLGATDECVE